MSEKMNSAFKGFIVPTDIIKAENLDIYEKMVYIVLRSFCNAHDDSAFPSYKTIAELGGMSVRKAQDSMKSLVEKGYIVKETRFKANKDGKIQQQSNVYHLQIPGAPHSPGGVHHMHGGGAPHARGGCTTCTLTNPY